MKGNEQVRAFKTRWKLSDLRATATSTSSITFWTALVSAGCSWLLLKDHHPVLAGVGFGMCLSLLASMAASLMSPHHDTASAPGRKAPSRKDALNVLAGHGLKAHFYLPAAGVEDQELANALRRVAAAGYIVTYEESEQLFGKVASIPMTSDEKAELRRAQFKRVK
jgi:hypothetical protein